MAILLTNDDGIDAPGLHALAGTLAQRGHDVVVVAPAAEASGSGAAVGPVHLTRRIGFRRQQVGDTGLVGVALDGPPALGVLTACQGGFGFRPELVVSGVNDGPNTGRAVLHSGTVGAVLTGANFGVSGLAVSACGRRFREGAEAAAALVEWLRTQPPATVVNVNVPDRPLDAMEGVCPARLASFGTVEAAFDLDGEVALTLRFEDRGAGPERGSDADLVARGWMTVTRLQGVRATSLHDGDAAATLAAGVVGRAAPPLAVGW